MSAAPKKLLPPEIEPVLSRELHEAAMRFRESAPWRWMPDRYLVCVIAGDGTPWFVCVLGAGKEVFGLSLYRGESGLSLFSEMQAGLSPDSVAQFMDGLTLWFVAKNELNAHEKKVYAEMGYAPPRGTRNAWPQYLSYRPGYAPWHLDEAEAGVLLTVLRRLTPFAEKLRDNPALWTGKFPKNSFIQETPVLDSRKDAPADNIPLEWRTWTAKPHTGIYADIVIADDEKRRRLKELSLLPTENDLHLEFAVFPVGIADEPPRPFPVKMALVGDSKSGMILYQEKTESAQTGFPLLLAMRFLMMLEETVAKNKSRPQSVSVSDQELADKMREYLDLMGIKLKCVRHLPTLGRFQRMLMRMM